MKPYEILTQDTAPEASKEDLAKSQSAYGMIPNLQGVMAHSPHLLKTHLDGLEAFEQTSLTPIEQQVVYLTTNFENNCEYCVPWHTKLAQMANMPADEIDNLRSGRALKDGKLDALHTFTKTMVRTRGSIAPADLQAFMDAGYNQQNALEVVLGIANKVVSNYTAALTQAPLDNQIKPLEWKKPTLRG